MKREVIFWLVGGAVSLVFHIGLSSLLEFSVEPDPVENQDIPEARLEMTAYEVRRSEVREDPVTGEQAALGKAQQTALSQDAIPRVTATAQTPQAIPAPAAPLSADDLPPTVDLTGAAVAAASLPQAPAISASRPDAAAMTAAEPPSDRITGSIVSGEPAAPSQTPRSDWIAASAAGNVAASVVQPGAAKLDSASPKALVMAWGGLSADKVAAAEPSGIAVAAAVAVSISMVPAQANPTTAASLTSQPTRIAEISDQQAVPVLVASLAPGLRASIERPRTKAVSDVWSDTSEQLSVFRPASEQGEPVETEGTSLDSGDLPSATAEPQPAPSRPATESAPATMSQELPPQTPPAEFATASLAWSGSTKASFDPASLAAIQSFMTESDLSATESNAGSVRDGIAALLSQVPCSRLQVAFVPESGSLELRGHVPEEGLRLPVLAALQARMGASIPVIDNLLILPRPQCGALSGIGSVGLPQSTDQLTNPLLVGADAHAKLYRYTEGERLTFDLTAPDYDAFVYVDYFDANGMVIHLVPNNTVTLEKRAAKSNVSIGTDRADGNFLAVTIGPPYGQEIAVAFAASEPLYQGIRPTVEAADAYLDWLREQITRARADNADFKGEWVYFFVATSQGG